MPRRIDKVSSMTKGHITMSMNKLNLFNIYRKDPLQYFGKHCTNKNGQPKQKPETIMANKLRKRGSKMSCLIQI